MKKTMRIKLASLLAAAVAVCSTSVMSSFAAQTKYNDSAVMQYETFTPSYQTSWIEDEMEKFPNGKYWNGGKADGYTSQACMRNNHSNDNYFQHDYVYQEAINGGYVNIGPLLGGRCTGFAQKLASDFYGGSRNPDKAANVWIQHRYKEGMKLRVGDHIRIKQEGHSMFVTAVDGDSITLADCNWWYTCRIRWNHTELLKDLHIISVERPVMVGDANLDSEFNAEDIQLISQIAKRNEWVYDYDLKKMVKRGNDVFRCKEDPSLYLPKALVMQAADMNADGKVDLNDWSMAWDEWNHPTKIPGVSENFYNLPYLTGIGEVK